LQEEKRALKNHRWGRQNQGPTPWLKSKAFNVEEKSLRRAKGVWTGVLKCLWNAWNGAVRTGLWALKRDHNLVGYLKDKVKG